MQTTANWTFPLPRTHTGILMGNATMGFMIWGIGNRLCVTVGRADLWDHRGGMSWTQKQNYRDIRAALEANDEEAMAELFKTDTEKTPGQPQRPSVIPIGRLELEFAEDTEMLSGSLEYATGIVTITLKHGGTQTAVRFHLAMNEQLAAIELPPASRITVTNHPAYTTLGSTLKDISFSPPKLIDAGDTNGWTQEFPNDPGIALLHQREGDTLWLATARSRCAGTMRQEAQQHIDAARRAGITALRDSCNAWWTAYWSDVPEIELPNTNLQFLYQYGMYKLAASSQPDGIACTLQGPWIEEYQLPPWSSDYHFNINVQMCYWPVYKGNRLSHLKPLFDLVFRWENRLRENARLFVGIEDGLMLPHAVDDRATCMGAFWSGSIDHACTAWVAQMMFDYACYTGDEVFLRDRALPFMKGTLRVYQAMLERDNQELSLPVSVSPEYRGSAMNAWGKNASFQLASIHRLLENLQAAVAWLGETPDPVWSEIQTRLPKACLIGEGQNAHIALWQGTGLEESHRHHSHLAGIVPFETLDLNDPVWQPILRNSIHDWIRKGMGMWSGWCVPWASMIHSRVGNGEAAEQLLSIWQSLFTNQGHGTLHDAGYAGISLMGAPPFGTKTSRPEIMQLDAGMGVVAAIQEMLLHTRRGVLHIFPGVPQNWNTCHFSPMPTEFGVLVGATREGGTTREVTLRATRSTTIRLASPFHKSTTLIAADGNQTVYLENILLLNLKADETLTLRATDEGTDSVVPACACI